MYYLDDLKIFFFIIRHEDSVQHFKILKDGNNKFYIWSSSSFSINQLVDKYHNDNVSGDPRKTIMLKDVKNEVSSSKILTKPLQVLFSQYSFHIKLVE